MTTIGQPEPLELAAHLVNAARAQWEAAEKALFAALDIRHATPGGRREGTCGTPAGIQRHRRASELLCAACLAARRWERNRAHTRRAP